MNNLENPIQTEQKNPMFVFKPFHEFPDAFEDLRKLSQEDFICFLCSSVDLYLDYIYSEQKRKLKLLDYIHIKERMHKVNETNELGDLGIYRLKDIPFAILSIFRYLMNERNKEENIYGNQEKINNARFLFTKKYLSTIQALIFEKYFDIKNKY